MVRFTTILISLLMIVGVTSNPVTITADGGDIDVPSPQNMTTWRSGSYQSITWKEKDPQNPVAKPKDTVSVEIWQYGFGLDPHKVVDVEKLIPFNDLHTSYWVPTEPEFSKMGLMYDTFNYAIQVFGDQESPGGSYFWGQSGTFKFSSGSALQNKTSS